jgi:hypothetical protein
MNQATTKFERQVIVNTKQKGDKKMVEIMYGDHYKQAELAGKSVAEARGQYQDEFGIPSKAQAKLNDNWVKTKREAETELSDDDTLSFEVKQRGKIPILAGALLLALAITGGVFAYGFVGGMVIPFPAGVGHPLFANVTSLTPTGIGNVSAGTWGNITERSLANITRHANYTGDMTFRVHLVDAGDLARSFQHLNLRMNITALATPFPAPTERLITLHNAEATFDVGGFPGSRNYTVWLVHGSFHALATVDTHLPLLFYIDVTPRR